MRAVGPDGQRRDLLGPGVAPPEGTRTPDAVKVKIGTGGRPYIHALPIAALRERDGQPLRLAPGGRIEIAATVRFGAKAVSPKASVQLVERSPVPPPAAAYLLLERDTAAQPVAYKAAAYGWGPLPDRVEFVDLANDLRADFVRRLAQFRWILYRPTGTAATTSWMVQKNDRSGSMHIPDSEEDFVDVRPAVY